MAGKMGTVSRRAEYAEATRRAIIAAARELFVERGYTATKVDEVAALARVSPATVYAVAGGKQGLLHTLVDDWTQAPEVDEAYRAIEASDSADRDRSVSGGHAAGGSPACRPGSAETRSARRRRQRHAVVLLRLLGVLHAD